MPLGRRNLVPILPPAQPLGGSRTFGFVFFDNLYMQVIQGFIHDDHEDLINKHVMMLRVTDNI